MKIKQSRMLRREKYQAWLSIAPTLILIVIMSARADGCHKLYTMERGRRP